MSRTPNGARRRLDACEYVVGVWNDRLQVTWTETQSRILAWKEEGVAVGGKEDVRLEKMK